MASRLEADLLPAGLDTKPARARGRGHEHSGQHEMHDLPPVLGAESALQLEGVLESTHGKTRHGRRCARPGPRVLESTSMSRMTLSDGDSLSLTRGPSDTHIACAPDSDSESTSILVYIYSSSMILSTT